MKSQHVLRVVIPVAALLAAAALRAGDMVRYEAQPGSKMRIDGTSTMHDWTVESKISGGSLELDPAFDADLKTLKVQPKADVTITVRTLKSDKKPSMDAVMYDTMKHKEHPKIAYKLIELTPKSDPGQFDAKGALTIAGVTRTNTMPVTFERLDKSKLKVSGTTAVKMTDFGLTPPAPKLALGLIKTGDDVKLTFEWLTARPEASK